MEAFLSVNDVVVRYADYGKGEQVVVMLHGYGQSIELLEEFGGRLGKSYRVIAIELPGSGLSTYGDLESISMEFMAEVVAGTLTKLGVESYNLLAHSMGGYVASVLVDIDRDRIQRLVMFHSLPIADSELSREKREREIALILAGKKEMLVSLNPLKGFSKLNERRCSDQIEEKIEQFLLTDDAALVATLKGMAQRSDRTESIRSFSAANPVLFIFGADDPYISNEVWVKVLEELPKASFEVLENSGHMGFCEELDRSEELVRKFLAQ